MAFDCLFYLKIKKYINTVYLFCDLFDYQEIIILTYTFIYLYYFLIRRTVKCYKKSY